MDTEKRTRRGNGEAEIRKRGDSYWTRVLINGRRHSVTGRTKYEGYAETARRYILPALGNTRLTQLQPLDLERLYSEMLDRGLAPSTVRKTHNVTHAMLKHALYAGAIARNVADIARPPKLGGTEKRSLTPEQVKTLLAAADSQWRALIQLAIGTSLRQGELLGLRWQDIDLEGGTLQVRRQWGREHVFREPKSRSARRTVDLPLPTVGALRGHKVKQLEQRLLLGSEYEDHDLVFCTESGKPLYHQNVRRGFTRLLVRAGLPHFSFHELRHTSATLSLLQGVPVKVVQERLGHANVSLTLQTYSHVLPSMGKDAADKLGALLG